MKWHYYVKCATSLPFLRFSSNDINCIFTAFHRPVPASIFSTTSFSDFDPVNTNLHLLISILRRLQSCTRRYIPELLLAIFSNYLKVVGTYAHPINRQCLSILLLSATFSPILHNTSQRGSPLSEFRIAW